MATLIKTLKQDWSLSATVAGFLAVLISYAGPMIIFFQAAQQANVSSTMMASWIWGSSIGAAITGIILSIKYKVPIITAWSAPGTALLVALFPHISLNEVVAAYITSAVIIFFIEVTGSFDKLLKWIPQGVAAGMMAGILFQFGVGLFKATDSMPYVVFGMLACFLLAKRFSPRYAIIWVLLSGITLRNETDAYVVGHRGTLLMVSELGVSPISHEIKDSFICSTMFDGEFYFGGFKGLYKIENGVPQKVFHMGRDDFTCFALDSHAGEMLVTGDRWFCVYDGRSWHRETMPGNENQL